MEQLAIPVSNGGKVFTHVDTKEPSASTLADAQKEADQGHYYKAIHKFLSGSIATYHMDGGDTVDDPAKISAITRDMPYVSADTLAMHVLVELNEDDLFEGVYQCPRCSTQIICEKTDDDDTRDSISALNVEYMADYASTFTVTLSTPIVIPKGKQEIEEISTMTFTHPTLAHCIKAASKMPANDKVRRQLQIYAESIVTVNEDAAGVADAWRANYGMYIMTRLSPRKDVKQIATSVSSFGIDARVFKTCPNCGKQFYGRVNTSNFFGSALQLGT